MMTWAQWGLQDAASPVMEEFIFFHDFTLILIVYVTVFVLIIMVKSLLNQFISLNLLEGQLIECIWTVFPAVVLIQVAIPSLMLLYMLDEAFNSQVTVKVIGHQWYWSYEYSDFWSKSPIAVFDAYMISPLDMKDSSIRLLDVDNRTTLPFSVSVRMLVSSADVLHAWTVPALGVKVDACPGRINQLNLMSYRPGVYYGQCSEICGANHSFMPISVEFISPVDYFWWASE